MDAVSIAEAARRLGVSREEIRSRIRKGELESRQMSTATGVGMGVVLPDDGSSPQGADPAGGQPVQSTQPSPPPQPIGGVTPPPPQDWAGEAPTITPPARPAATQPPPPPPQPPRPQAPPGQPPPPTQGWAAQAPTTTPPPRPATPQPPPAQPIPAPPQPPRPPPPPYQAPAQPRAVDTPGAGIAGARPTPPPTVTPTPPPTVTAAAAPLAGPAAPPRTVPPLERPATEAPPRPPAPLRQEPPQAQPPPASVVEPRQAPPMEKPLAGPAQVESRPTVTYQPPPSQAAGEPFAGEVVQSYRVEPQQRQGRLLQQDVEPPAPPPKPSRSSPLRELVSVLQHQVEIQGEELQARRREVQELHVLLQQLQSRALPAPPEDTTEPPAARQTDTPPAEAYQPTGPESRMSWWERLWRKG